MDFSRRLKELREEHGLKQIDLAEMLGISMQSISAYENGREPNYETLCTLADHFNVTTDYLLGKSSYKLPIGQVTYGPGIDGLKKRLEECAALGADRLIEALNDLLGRAVTGNKIFYGDLDTLILDDVAAFLEKWSTFLYYAGPYVSAQHKEIAQGREGAKNRLYETVDECRSVLLASGKAIINNLYSAAEQSRRRELEGGAANGDSTETR